MSFGYQNKFFEKGPLPKQQEEAHFIHARIILGLIPLILGGLILLRGGQMVEVKGAFYLLVGLFLFFRSPQSGIGVWGDRVLLLAIFLPFLAFLPAWIVPHGQWYTLAIHEFAIPLPFSIVADWQLFFEDWVFVCCAVGAFYLFIDINPSHKERRLLLMEWAFVAALLALGLILGHAKGLKYVLCPEARVFTYFPSRNQTGTVFFLGGIVSFGLMMRAILKKQVLAFCILSICSLILLIASIETTSRAAVLLFCLGSCIFIYFQFRGVSQGLLLKLLLPFLLICASLFILVGGNTQRMLQFLKTGDFRFSLYLDSASLILDQFLTGVGLGNFKNIIPFYRHASAMSERALHPESDFLWWGTEVGILGLIILILFIWQIGKTLFPLIYRERVSSRAIPTAALIAYAFHAMFDVPMHFLGSLMPALFLYAMAKKPSSESISFSPWVFRLLGLILISSGSLWVYAGIFQVPLFSSIEQEQDRVVIQKSMNQGELGVLESLFDSALKRNRFDWWLYYERANFWLYYFQKEALAQQDFRRSLFVEPLSAEVPFWIGIAWLPYSPQEAYQNWLEAVKRYSNNREWMYIDMMRRSCDYPAFKPYLDKLSQSNEDFRASYLLAIDPLSFKEKLSFELKRNPDFRAFELSTRRALFIKWAKVDAPFFLAYFNEHEATIPDAWLAEAEAFLAEKQWQKAATIFHNHISKPILLSEVPSETLSEALHKFVLSPQDIWLGTKLLFLQIQAEEWKGALSTLEILAQHPPVPAFVSYWKAEIYFQEALFEKSCNAWTSYLESLQKSIKSDPSILEKKEASPQMNLNAP